MKYKVGDRVKIKSLDWYNRHTNGTEVDCGKYPFTSDMKEFCGQERIIANVCQECYFLLGIDDKFVFTDEMIEGLVEEETKPNIIEEAKTYWDSIKDAWICPEGYIFKDENGNIINAQKIVLEKKKKEYPKFKVGDRIKRKGDIRLTTIKDIKDNYYIITIPDFFGNAYITDKLLFSNQNEYELFPNKFDITNLRPFDKVLVRGDVGQKWTHDFFGFMDKDKGYPFVCVGHYIIQCIPYEGNECLLGTTNDCDDFYKTWK